MISQQLYIGIIITIIGVLIIAFSPTNNYYKIHFEAVKVSGIVYIITDIDKTYTRKDVANRLRKLGCSEESIANLRIYSSEKITKQMFDNL